MTAPLIIAVDGPTASGKGTIARALATHYGLPHLDTGLLYRAVGRQCALGGGNPDDPADALGACDFPDDLLADPELRTEASGGLASRVSIHPGVRHALYERQRAFATQGGGAVLDGRDIGTVIAPEAVAKLFVTASVAARAARSASIASSVTCKPRLCISRKRRWWPLPMRSCSTIRTFRQMARLPQRSGWWNCACTVEIPPGSGFPTGRGIRHGPTHEPPSPRPRPRAPGPRLTAGRRPCGGGPRVPR
jgi:hypothetical protein